MIPLESVKNIPIADVCNVLNIPLIRTGNSLQSAKCPGGHESKNGNCFSVDISGNYFRCFSCGISGDVVKLVQIGKGLTFTDSLKWLGDTFGIADDPNYKPLKVEEKPKAEWTPKTAEIKESDNETWQSKALSFISYAEKQLAESPEIMGYLIKERFLSPDTVKRFRLGYNPELRYIPCEDFGLAGNKKVKIPKGVVIPYMADERILRLRIRIGKGDYWLVRGSHTTPYQIDNGKSVWVIVESDLDAILNHQEVSDLVNIAAIESKKEKPDEALHKKIFAAEKILVSLDFKPEGSDDCKEFFGFWKKQYPNAYFFPPLRGKDHTEMVASGIPIRTWLKTCLKSIMRGETGASDMTTVPMRASADINECESGAPVEPPKAEDQAFAESFSDLPLSDSAPVQVERTFCCGYLQGNCEFVIRETSTDCVMKCGHGGIIRNVWEMPDCPMKFWTRDSKGMPISLPKGGEPCQTSESSA